MSVADGGTGATTRATRRLGRRGTTTLVCILLVGSLGLALTRAPSVAGSQRLAANSPWPAFAQTASEANTWIVAVRAFATAETNSDATAEPAWPAFTQTASDAGTWLVALRTYADAEVQVEQAAQAAAARAAQAAAQAAAARSTVHSATYRPPPPPPPAPWDGVVPPAGQATAWGCDAALAYLQAYAAPGFALECPGYAEGHQGMTCFNEPGACPNEAIIVIATPCPQSYMNEASNSWVLTGRSNAPIDPYGGCR